MGKITRNNNPDKSKSDKKRDADMAGMERAKNYYSNSKNFKALDQDGNEVPIDITTEYLKVEEVAKQEAEERAQLSRGIFFNRVDFNEDEIVEEDAWPLATNVALNTVESNDSFEGDDGDNGDDDDSGYYVDYCDDGEDIRMVVDNIVEEDEEGEDREVGVNGDNVEGRVIGDNGNVSNDDGNLSQKKQLQLSTSWKNVFEKLVEKFIIFRGEHQLPTTETKSPCELSCLAGVGCSEREASVKVYFFHCKVYFKRGIV